MRAVFHRKAAEGVFNVPVVDFLDFRLRKQHIALPQQFRKIGFVIGFSGQGAFFKAEALLRVLVGEFDFASGIKRQNAAITAIQQPVLIVADTFNFLHPFPDFLLEREIEGHEHQRNNHHDQRKHQDGIQIHPVIFRFAIHALPKPFFVQSFVDAVFLDELQALIEHAKQGIIFSDRQAIPFPINFPADNLQFALSAHLLQKIFPGQAVPQHGIDLALQETLQRFFLVGGQSQMQRQFLQSFIGHIVLINRDFFSFQALQSLNVPGVFLHENRQRIQHVTFGKVVLCLSFPVVFHAGDGIHVTAFQRPDSTLPGHGMNHDFMIGGQRYGLQDIRVKAHEDALAIDVLHVAIRGKAVIDRDTDHPAFRSLQAGKREHHAQQGHFDEQGRQANS